MVCALGESLSGAARETQTGNTAENRLMRILWLLLAVRCPGGEGRRCEGVRVVSGVCSPGRNAGRLLKPTSSSAGSKLQEKGWFGLCIQLVRGQGSFLFSLPNAGTNFRLVGFSRSHWNRPFSQHIRPGVGDIEPLRSPSAHFPTDD